MDRPQRPRARHLERSTLTRFTLEDGDESHPAWSAKNDAIFYYGQGRDLFRQSLRGTRKPELVLKDGAPLDASPDGRWLERAVLRHGRPQAVPAESRARGPGREPDRPGPELAATHRAELSGPRDSRGNVRP